MRKYIQSYWFALRDAFGPVAAGINTLVSIFGVFQSAQQTLWPKIVDPVLRMGTTMIPLFTLLSLVIMVVACLHHIVKLKQPSQKFIDAQVFLDKTIKKFEGYKQISVDFSDKDELPRVPYQNDNPFTIYRTSKRNFEIALRGIMNDETIKRFLPYGNGLLHPGQVSDWYKDETGGPYQRKIPGQEVEYDLKKLGELKRNMTPFWLKDFNSSDLLTHEI